MPHEKFLYFVVLKSLFNVLAGTPENVMTRPDSGVLSYVCTVHEAPEERLPAMPDSPGWGYVCRIRICH